MCELDPRIAGASGTHATKMWMEVGRDTSRNEVWIEVGKWVLASFLAHAGCHEQTVPLKWLQVSSRCSLRVSEQFLV